MPDFFRGDIGDELGDVGELLEAIRRRPGWHADALCKEAPPEVDFFATGKAAEEAKRVCSRCLVVFECRTWAAGQGADLKGTWGGLSEEDRRALRAPGRPGRKRAA